MDSYFCCCARAKQFRVFYIGFIVDGFLVTKKAGVLSRCACPYGSSESLQRVYGVARAHTA